MMGTGASIGLAVAFYDFLFDLQRPTALVSAADQMDANEVAAKSIWAHLSACRSGITASSTIWTCFGVWRRCSPAILLARGLRIGAVFFTPRLACRFSLYFINPTARLHQELFLQSYLRCLGNKRPSLSLPWTASKRHFEGGGATRTEE